MMVMPGNYIGVKLLLTLRNSRAGGSNGEFLRPYQGRQHFQCVRGSLALGHHTHQFTRTEEAIMVLFCLIDDAYANLNPRGRRYESLKRLSDSEVITLALFQQVCGASSQSAPSYATLRGSSRTSSPAWSALPLLPSIAPCAT